VSATGLPPATVRTTAAENPLWHSEPVARWSDLTEFLATAPDRCLLSMEQLEEIVGTLPHSARTHRAYWYGDRPQVRAWRAAGFVLDHVAVGRGVVLRREEPVPTPPDNPDPPLEEVPEEAELEGQPGRDAPDVVLVSCSSRKTSRPAAAKDLYTSALFRRKRAYAEESGAPWFILSAEHALVAPDEWLSPYDRYLPETPRSFRAAWGAWVAERLELLVGPLKGLEIEIHASAAYAQAVSPFLVAKEAVVTRPLAGLRQGEQLAFYGTTTQTKRTRDHAARAQSVPAAVTVVAALLDEHHAVTPAYFLAQDPAGLRVPGLYSWWVDEEGAADLSRAAHVTTDSGLVYAGLAGATRWPAGKHSPSTLWSRIAGVHLHGNHESSTFRRSLFALLTSPDGDGTVDEAALTAWMHAHLRVIAVPHEDRDSLEALEAVVLTALDPPLNLQGMPSTPFRRSLKDLRRHIAR
jgi:hypothetical protein